MQARTSPIITKDLFFTQFTRVVFDLRGIYTTIPRRQEQIPGSCLSSGDHTCVASSESNFIHVLLTLTLPYSGYISIHPILYINLSFSILTKFSCIFSKMSENFLLLSNPYRFSRIVAQLLPDVNIFLSSGPGHSSRSGPSILFCKPGMDTHSGLCSPFSCCPAEGLSCPVTSGVIHGSVKKVYKKNVIFCVVHNP